MKLRRKEIKEKKRVKRGSEASMEDRKKVYWEKRGRKEDFEGSSIKGRMGKNGGKISF